jgi:hypothetical protein
VLLQAVKSAKDAQGGAQSAESVPGRGGGPVSIKELVFICACLSVSAGIHLHVANNSYDRMHL